MKTYDIIVIGSGSGMAVVDEAVSDGLKVALVDKGPLGGTCPNLGCIPSKVLIYAADRVLEIKNAKKLGIEAEISHIDFAAIMNRMRTGVRQTQQNMRQGIHELKIDYYEGEGRFESEHTLEVNGQKLRGEKIVIACGSRPFIPPIKGLDTIDYLTNESALQLKEKPDSLIIIGGGYIAVEFGHFFSAMGTEVTILEMMDRLVLAEEPEIAELLKAELGKRMGVYTGMGVEEVLPSADGCKVICKEQATGKRQEFGAARVMVAVGRRSNADTLALDKTGVEQNEKGFIKVDRYLQTSKEGIYAIGDANGQQMFTHIANKEAAIAAENILHNTEMEIGYTAAPHAVYSYPQIASVGMREEDARKQYQEQVTIGKGMYADTAKGEAMMEDKGFAKVIIHKESGKILGFHIIGPAAPILIQEVVNAMESEGHLDELFHAVHIHPALSELIQLTLSNIEYS